MALTHSLLILLALLFVKHFFADGPLQTSKQVANKGKWLHPDGFAHAGTHAALSGVCILLWSALFSSEISAGGLAALLGALLPAEFVVHYMIDFSKCALERNTDWSHVETGADGKRRLVIESDRFFFSFLLDQLGHALTYVAMVALLAAMLF